MKQNILNCKLQNPSWGNKRIAAFVGCSPNTVKYHLNPTEKSKALVRKNRHFSKLKGILKRKKDNFLSTGEKRFSCVTGKALGWSRLPSSFSAKELEEKLLANPVCYLTGRKIDLLAPKTYQLDHIIPASAGGSNELSNCALTCKDANMSKHYLSIAEFEQLCKEVLTHRGFTIH